MRRVPIGCSDRNSIRNPNQRCYGQKVVLQPSGSNAMLISDVKSTPLKEFCPHSITYPPCVKQCTFIRAEFDAFFATFHHVIFGGLFA